VTTVIVAIIVLGVLIFVHELGHFLVAKGAGVRVETFSLGFGPRLLGFKRGDTDYRLSAIPLGGFVRMTGEDPGEEVAPEDIPYSFSHKSLLRRFAIVAAGPVSNLIFAMVVYYILMMVWGVATLSSLVGQVQPGSPAALAGIHDGDVVRAIDGQPVEDWGDMVRLITKSGGRELRMSLERGGNMVQVSVKPEEVTDTDIFGEEFKVYRVGIAAATATIIEKDVGAWEGVGMALIKSYQAGKLIFLSVVKLIQQKVSLDSMGGPILIAQAAGQAAERGMAPLLDLAALISVNLAVLNLLPIPALDGGHLFFFLIEALTRRPVSMKVREKAQQFGVALLLVLMAFVFYNDIARLLTGGGIQ
jgi:regulator of sigma E protease